MTRRPRRPAGRRPPAGLGGARTFAEFSDLIGEIDLFPAAAPEREVSRPYRRWAFESAALDLALRQADTNLADRPSAASHGRSTSSPRCASPPSASEQRSSIDPLLARLAVYPNLRFKLDPTNDWDDELIAALVRDRRGRLARPQGLLQRHPGRRRDRPGALRQADRGLPRRLARGPRRQRRRPSPLLDPVADRVTWDAPIHSIADIEAMPWAPRMVNIKPSRFGAVRDLFATYDYCEEQRHRRLRRRPDRARPGPRPDPVPRLDLPSRHAQRRRPLAATTTPSGRAAAGLPTSPTEPGWSRTGFRWEG